jgi:hypothetical protein
VEGIGLSTIDRLDKFQRQRFLSYAGNTAEKIRVSRPFPGKRVAENFFLTFVTVYIAK